MTQLIDNLPEWTSFNVANPKTGTSLLIKLKDGRELNGVRFHVELHFQDVANGSLKDSHWDLQMQSTHWKYI